MGRIVNELDSIQFSIKKASQLVKEISRQVGFNFISSMHCLLSFKTVMELICISLFQVATDKCIMLFLFLIVCGVIAIIVVKVSFSCITLWICTGYFFPVKLWYSF